MLRKIFIVIAMIAGIAASSLAQEGVRPQPKVWLGFSGAANLNSYTGTTQMLNPNVYAQSAFHNGFGVGHYVSFFAEYRPTPVLGFMLNLGYDSRQGKFNQVMAPCNCPADLYSKISYFSIDPSIRIAPFASNFYVFFGAGYSYNLGFKFIYEQDLQPTVHSEFSNIRQNSWSTHVGIGYEIPLASVNSLTQVNLSPFVMFKPYFGQNPRDIESWDISTLRVGMAIKFGKTKAVAKAQEAPVYYYPPVAPVAPVVEKEAKFSVQVPVVIPTERVVKETFPLRNYVFFEEGSTEIPSRYIKLNKADALKFKIAQFQEPEPKDISHRSKRQLTAYNNILNILGNRMRDNKNLDVTLIGASAGNGSALGLSYAESVKKYLVNVFDISPLRIKTEGRNQPINPSEQPGGTKFLTLLREGDRRVDIVSKSGDLLAPLQITAVQQDPLDSRIYFITEDGSKSPIKSWNLEVSDESGIVQHYGPFTKNKESVSGNAILKDRKSGSFKAVMVGKAEDGSVIRKESTFKLSRSEAPVEGGYRFSILFDFDQPKTVASYDKFLTDVVAPLVKNNGTVIIHGHTDIIGDDEYNVNLSEQRAQDVKRILEQALKNLGTTGVKFEAYGFGSDKHYAPFENKLPEERFYNRTVIIDVIPY
ncbi:MAG: flagellar motor protein MotB [Bacteroidetes bacterium GWE2_39_28]|nr:MAG: flagellar motor protein MotB [Bacteroidetes bacterium GWE2_39_28]OFZ09047.1 MAG: flagellar motor protein MotB [Bacteroidetes bacterium RIFOXYB2_FULL_39_7]OFZ10720.1 MAG: flagellar motor protein MotB [Bacteroidetes bacterium RIFOXYC2_FULL_39_11]HCT93219.1 flagellar motor protein MotB [Rikenellaceae bacterium]